MNDPLKISQVVSVRKQSRSLQNRSRHRKSLKKRSSSVIHVKLRLSKNHRQHHSYTVTSLPSSNRTTRKSQNNPVDHSLCDGPTTFYTASSEKSLATSRNDEKKKDTLANPMDYRCKQLSNPKKKKDRRLKRMVLLCNLMICIILPAALLPLLLKSTPTRRSIIINGNVTLRWNTSGITVGGISGVVGNQSDQLYNPWGLALTYENTLYIADQYNRRIQKYLRGSSNGITVAGLANTTTCSGLQCLAEPSNIILDDNENMYIADATHHRILFWKNGASSGTRIAGSGGYGSANNQFAWPYNIARDPQTGTLYVSDNLNHRVMMYTSGSNSGVLVAGGNGAGNSTTQLSYPMGVYFDSFSNSLIIANAGANNIVRWGLGETSWTLVAGSMNGSAGSLSSLLRGPFGLTYDPMGNLYVADSGNSRIQFFSPGQTLGRTVAGVTGRLGYNNTLLDGPYGLILDNQLNLFVADTWNNRVQKFLRH